ncbi:MAG: murein biosynthesis integral membrane protein MurJ, partial [Anaerolineae bacterium]|nr:murein biosynthesis integral membrane protein MurJ [Anaerolineae bacterium]
AAGLLSLLVIIFAPWIVAVVLQPGRPPEVQALTVALVRVMMLTPAIFSVSGLLMGILQTYQRFLLPSLAISMNNVGLIIGALVLAYVVPPQPGSPAQVGGANVYGLAWGAVLSAALHLLVQLPALRGLWSSTARLRVLADWRVSGVREVLMLMLPRVLGLGVAQLNFIVNVNFASRMVTGSQTALSAAWNLMFFALGVIGQSVGTAIFPSLAALAAEGDMPGFKARLAAALRSVLFLALPATAVLVILGQPLITLLFERRQWTAESSAATAWALAFFALGIAGHAGLELLSRAFYALSDTRTPVLAAVVSLLTNIVLSAVFIQFIGQSDSLTRGPFAGLALANSVTTLLEALALWWLLRRRIGDLNDRRVLDGILRTAGATAALVAALLVAQALLAERLPMALYAVIALGIGGVVFSGASLALRLDEPRAVLGVVLRRFRRG